MVRKLHTGTAMKRVDEFEVRPRTPEQREALLNLLDASAALWNELTYNRCQAFFNGDSVWHATNPSDRYKDVLGSATVQQIPRKNSEAWRSFFALNEKYHGATETINPAHPGTGATRKMAENCGRTSVMTSTPSSGATEAASKFPSGRR